MRRLFTSGIAAAAIICLLSGCSEQRESVVEYLPAQLTEGGAWVFIDEAGNQVGTQQWEFEPTVTKNGVFVARGDSGLTVYRWDGETAEALDSLKNLASAGMYNEGVLPVAPYMQRIRVVDSNGDTRFELMPIDGKEIMSCSGRVSDGRLVVTNEDQKCGVVDMDGNVVVKPEYDIISDFTDGHAIATVFPKSPDDWQMGPTYYVLSVDGTAPIKVEGQFGYFEGDCYDYSGFERGYYRALAPQDSTDEYINYVLIDTDGRRIMPAKADVDTVWTDNGCYLVTTNTPDSDTPVVSTWYGADGNRRLTKNGYGLSVVGDYAYANDWQDGKGTTTIYDHEGKILKVMDGNCIIDMPDERFGLVVNEFDDNGNMTKAYFLNPKREHEGDWSSATFVAIGTREYVTLYDGEEMECVSGNVTSAYVDITAAATKFSTMVKDGQVKGKDYYYVGQPLSEVLQGENAQYYSGSSGRVMIPTSESTYNVGQGAGFWINGEILSSANVVQPTYSKYFDVAYYDYYGSAWGYWRKKQSGVKFNPSAKIEGFDLRLHTNHNSGAVLREAVGRHLKNAGYVLVGGGDTYDEYHCGANAIIVYGAPTTKGIGALVRPSDKMKELTAEEKSTLAANL